MIEKHRERQVMLIKKRTELESNKQPVLLLFENYLCQAKFGGNNQTTHGPF